MSDIGRQLCEHIAGNLSGNSFVRIKRVDSRVRGAINVESISSLSRLSLVDEVGFMIWPRVYSEHSQPKITIEYNIEFSNEVQNNLMLAKLFMQGVDGTMPSDLEPSISAAGVELKLERLGVRGSFDIFDQVIDDLNRLHKFGQQSIGVLQAAHNAIENHITEESKNNWYDDFAIGLRDFFSGVLTGDFDFEFEGGELSVTLPVQDFIFVFSMRQLGDDKANQTAEGCLLEVTFAALSHEGVPTDRVEEVLMKTMAFNSRAGEVEEENEYMGAAALPVFEGEMRFLFGHQFALTVASSWPIAANYNRFIDGARLFWKEVASEFEM